MDYTVTIEEPASPPICVKCAHLHRPGVKPELTCDAFPDGILRGILEGRLDHTEPIDGDGGIQFEAVEEQK
jgi:hypothetical protein